VVVNTWVADRHCGTAAPHAGARALSRRLDLDALRAYREAVEEATRAAVGALGASDLDESVPASRLVRSAPDRTYANPGGRWMDEFWAERNRGWFLAFVNTHNAEHLIAEALTVRSLSGFPLGI